MNKILLTLCLLFPTFLVGCSTMTPEQQDAYQQLITTTGVSYAVMAYIEQSDDSKKIAEQIIKFIDYTLDPSVPYVNVEGLSPKDKMLVNTIVQVIEIEMKDVDYSVNSKFLNQLKNLVYIYTI